ncbi:MAG: EamA family transporter [Zetaproteobacteria bacterium CG12_big_fil_rev_8_21_14_0_65_55_1124]|nr:MAG: EamA family transporter [Zetaproteobacteria bacterium CG1_02_55_237]PIS18506.1 MAG: EamA family transporter [Zetaproteobacteria bacterium CG08_land_8_20_14_0_20_55_17]PIW43040.1 MAG: EamA family transporter [Zetaproteobacteria bacterium CG12_big_fil_rev_8_21_14_0_65_55_1124]PIY52593.1 MAG: EamA family transporter [Zetaproteobacteria bacterium CG_4_10_14_0_8_um_filter_55_43]PIZ38438.1 MAG: EamA family transporter [Zetaproteobacteria bacterium CG_4_10_14_0_2_um_filter_55_20]PJB79337.1 MA
MSVPMAYIGVIMIWSTTPLAILWSSQDVGFVFGVTSRMAIGAVLALIVAALLGNGMKWHRRAMQAYVAAGLGIYGAMLSVYWAAQFIPSGWISLIFGLTPVVTGLMARLWLQGEALTPARLAGMFLGLAGLAVIFATGMHMDERMVFGIGGVLLSVLIHSASAVWVKRINADVPAIVLTSGGLAIATPLFLLTWFLSSNGPPVDVSARTAGSIAYLALFGSVLGFALYYYVLKKGQATRVAMITLITPVTALALGNMFNGEPLSMEIVLGATLILSGLALFETGGHAVRLRAFFQRL